MNAATRANAVVLLSGNGSNLQALLDATRQPNHPLRIVAAISDKADAYGLQRARAAGIDARSLSPADYPDRLSYDAALAALAAEYDPELIILAGFMRILSEPFISAFRGRMLNIHPALLPAYKGLHTHRRVLAAGDPVHGTTVHFVTQELDGGPCVIQALVDVRPGDSEASLSARIQAAEHRIYPMAARWFAEGRLRLDGDRVLLDNEPLEEPIRIGEELL
jgi:phosphoribosylglycinamide formyltransferase-1